MKKQTSKIRALTLIWREFGNAVKGNGDFAILD